MPTIPTGPRSAEPVAETSTELAIMGPTAVATPHSTTTRVKPMKMRIARISVAAAAHSGNPDSHSQPTMTTSPTRKVNTAPRYDMISRESSTEASPRKALRNTSAR